MRKPTHRLGVASRVPYVYAFIVKLCRQQIFFFFFFFQALNFLVESFGLLNDLFQLPSILDAGYPVFLSSFGICPV